MLNQMLALRNKIALRLGYKSWDDYQTEINMAKTARRRQILHRNLVAGIQPKFDAEVAELQKLKVEQTDETRTPKSTSWDWRYLHQPAQQTEIYRR